MMLAGEQMEAFVAVHNAILQLLKVCAVGSGNASLAFPLCLVDSPIYH